MSNWHVTACANLLTACAISGFLALTCFGFQSGPSSEFPDPPPDPASAIRFPFLWVLPCGCIAPQRGRTNMCCENTFRTNKEQARFTACLEGERQSRSAWLNSIIPQTMLALRCSGRLSYEAEWSVYKLCGWSTPVIFCCYL